LTPTRIALLGVGTIGRELVRRVLDNPRMQIVALADRSGVVAQAEAFSREELLQILMLKEAGGRLRDYEGGHDSYREILGAIPGVQADALVDVTDAQTYGLLYEALGHAHVVTSNKAPIADVPSSDYRRLVSRAEDEGRVLDIGTTAGAGLRVPDLVERLGCEGMERVTGCLSGTMNYVSQRLNEGAPLSEALREAMNPPRNYAEPDPRVDLEGVDFARKLVILGRMCGSDIERDWVIVEDLIPDELKDASVEGFLGGLLDLDGALCERVESARRDGKTSWYLGTADLDREVYTVGFESIPSDDPVARSRESDNVLKLYPRGWRRPVTIIGPGAGPPETVTGLMFGLQSIPDTR
jgi:homoserine dehydrogenase